MRKLFTDILKKLKKSCPLKAKNKTVKKAMITAFRAVLFLSFTVNSDVIDMKIGMVPRGLIRVKNEVKANSPKLKSSFMCLWFCAK